MIYLRQGEDSDISCWFGDAPWCEDFRGILELKSVYGFSGLLVVGTSYGKRLTFMLIEEELELRSI